MLSVSKFIRIYIFAQTAKETLEIYRLIVLLIFMTWFKQLYAKFFIILSTRAFAIYVFTSKCSIFLIKCSRDNHVLT